MDASLLLGLIRVVVDHLGRWVIADVGMWALTYGSGPWGTVALESEISLYAVESSLLDVVVVAQGPSSPAVTEEQHLVVDPT